MVLYINNKAIPEYQEDNMSYSVERHIDTLAAVAAGAAAVITGSHGLLEPMKAGMIAYQQFNTVNLVDFALGFPLDSDDRDVSLANMRAWKEARTNGTSSEKARFREYDIGFDKAMSPLYCAWARVALNGGAPVYIPPELITIANEERYSMIEVAQRQILLGKRHVSVLMLGGNALTSGRSSILTAGLNEVLQRVDF